MMETILIGYNGFQEQVSVLAQSAHNIANINTQGFLKEEGVGVDPVEELIDLKKAPWWGKANLLTMGSVSKLTESLIDILT